MILPDELIVMIMEFAVNLRTLRRVCKRWALLVDTHILHKRIPDDPTPFSGEGDLQVLQWKIKVYRIPPEAVQNHGYHALKWASYNGLLPMLKWLYQTYSLTSINDCIVAHALKYAVYEGTFSLEVNTL